MTKTQIRTQRISFVLALSVITYTVVDTYLFTYHDINVMKIMTPVIIGLVATIILCGLLHKFFYKWLIENPIHFSFCGQDSPIVEAKNTTESICSVETSPIEQPIDSPEQAYPSVQQSNQDIVDSD